MTKLSRALAAYNFFKALRPKGDAGRPLSKTLSEEFNLGDENSIEFITFVHSQRENLLRLHDDIRLSDMSEQSKKIYQDSVMALLNVVSYPRLSQASGTVRKEVIAAQLANLITLNDQIRDEFEIDENIRDEIKLFVGQLQEVNDDILSSSLPHALKRSVSPQLTTLIALLNNFETIGLERAWEVAAAAMLTLARDSSRRMNSKEGSVFKKSLKVVGGIVATLATFNAAFDQGEKFLGRSNTMITAIAEALDGPVPRLEYQPNESTDGEDSAE
jgi:hypothetical protein